jgi:hypothetical protein
MNCNVRLLVAWMNGFNKFQALLSNPNPHIDQERNKVEPAKAS